MDDDDKICSGFINSMVGIPKVIRSSETIYHLECPDCLNYFELMDQNTPCVVCGAKMKIICTEIQQREFSEVQAQVIVKEGEDRPHRYMSPEKFQQEKDERERKQVEAE